MLKTSTNADGSRERLCRVGPFETEEVPNHEFASVPDFRQGEA
jgi:hypothetical protein